MIVKSAEALFIRSWWVILIVLTCLVGYEQGLKTIHQEYSRLTTLHSQLAREKNQALHRQQDLLLRLNSQSDPRWIELVLMESLGLVPEGQKKVYFAPNTNHTP